MGGRALPHIPTRRLVASEFHRLAAELPSRLSERFHARVEPIQAYRTKPDFGDLDLLVDADALEARFGEEWPVALDEASRQVSHARAIVMNGARREGKYLIDTTTCSFDHRFSPADDEGFQVDLIMTRAATFEAAKAYYAYNDLGNLVGRVAHGLGFVHGHRGLLYPLRASPTQLLATLEVSRCPEQILLFLGYDPARFRQGFDTLDEIFEYAASSTYFRRNLYLLENRNHASRMRDRKRPTYAGFLRAIVERPEWPDRAPLSPEAALERAFEYFPAFRATYATALEPSPPSLVRQVFNGANIEAWTGLSGPAIGLLMARVRCDFPDAHTFASFVEQAGEEGVRSRVLAALAEGPLVRARSCSP